MTLRTSSATFPWKCWRQNYKECTIGKALVYSFQHCLPRFLFWPEMHERDSLYTCGRWHEFEVLARGISKWIREIETVSDWGSLARWTMWKNQSRKGWISKFLGPKGWNTNDWPRRYNPAFLALWLQCKQSLDFLTGQRHFLCKPQENRMSTLLRHSNQ